MEKIESAFIRNEFYWDYMSEVDWSVVKSGLSSAERVLSNPGAFPKANFDYLEQKAMELSCFMLKAPIHLM